MIWRDSFTKIGGHTKIRDLEGGGHGKIGIFTGDERGFGDAIMAKLDHMASHERVLQQILLVQSRLSHN